MIKKSCTLKIRGGVERDSYGKKAGKGALIQWERSGTLGVSQDQTLFAWTDEQPSPYKGEALHHNDPEDLDGMRTSASH